MAFVVVCSCVQFHRSMSFCGNSLILSTVFSLHHLRCFFFPIKKTRLTLLGWFESETLSSVERLGYVGFDFPNLELELELLWRMQAVGRPGSYITRVSGPFHPFGGAVDIVVVHQQDGSFMSSPWYLRFGKFLGVLKANEKVVNISVNEVEANFHMYLDHKGEAFFPREEQEGESIMYPSLSGGDTESDDNPHGDNKRPLPLETKSFNFDSDRSNSVAQIDVNNGNGKIVARISSCRSRILGLVFGRRSLKGDKVNNLQGKVEDADINRTDSLERAEIVANLLELKWSTNLPRDQLPRKDNKKHRKSSSQGDNLVNGLHPRELNEEGCYCTEQDGFGSKSGFEVPREIDQEEGVINLSCLTTPDKVVENFVVNESEVSTGIHIAEDGECDTNVKEVIYDTTGSDLQVECVELEARIEKHLNGEEVSGDSTIDMLGNSISEEDISADGIESLVYCETSDSSIVGMDCSSEQTDEVMYLASGGCGPVHVHAEVLHATTILLPEVTEAEEVTKNVDLGMPVMEVSELHSQLRDCSHSDDGKYDVADVEKLPKCPKSQTVNMGRHYSVNKIRANNPTSEQLASLNLKEGRNTVIFSLGKQQVDARIFLWKWNTRIVISDVDGTITKSDVLGQFMPLVGIDWSQTGVAHLFSAIKENGYQILFLSARAISQAYHTRQFLFNLKQDGRVLPDGPVVISPDGLFPSLYREVIRRSPHEFKIACLEDIRALFPSDCNPFYAGFGNMDTDEISYLKVGIPNGKIFIINPRGEIAVNRRLDTKSYTSLHALVNGMFPPRNSSEQEDFNSWNYWKLPPPVIDI